MAALLFDTCCGCIELRTGCLIIGYLNLVYSIISVIITLVAGLAIGVVASQDSEFRDELSKHEAVAAVSVIAIIVVVILLLLLILNIVFLVGIHQNKRGHVKAYLIFNVIFLVLYTLVFFSSFAQSPINWGSVGQTLITLLISLYFFLVIRSYYHKMNDSSRQPAIYNTA